ncbi:hypothetical protein Smic_29800 [Streptomyces microflavus]|uniref:Uncharacterized protein n=1 Tax=Streptomyces microflavus TaxID=1919 RepID=A0A7J0CR63_STRMI|nr:hypothetical protein Smic_29800 [Streptomyces microflavus]
MRDRVRDRVREQPMPQSTPYVHRRPFVLAVLFGALLLSLLVAPPAAADDGPGPPAGWTARPAGAGAPGRMPGRTSTWRAPPGRCSRTGSR